MCSSVDVQWGWATLTSALLHKNLVVIISIRLETYTVVARGDDLIVMLERHSAVFKHRVHISNTRCKYDLATFAHPYRRLVCSLESVYLGISVVIWRDRYVVLARLRDPARHGEGWSC